MIARKSSATMGAAEEHSTCNCEEFECDNGRSRAVLRVFEGFEYDDGRSRAVLQVFEAATHTALTCFLLLEQVCVSFGAGCFDQLWKPALPALPALSLPSYLHITMLHSCYCLPDSHVVQVLRNTTDAWCPLLVLCSSCSPSPRGVRLCMGCRARVRLCSVFSVLLVLCFPQARPVYALLSRALVHGR